MRYKSISGQVINFNKSSTIFRPNTTKLNGNLIFGILEVGEVFTPGKYLGQPMSIKSNKTDAFNFLVDRVEQVVS